MKSTAASEEAVVRGLRSGDSRAFRQVYDDYHASIYNLCARIVGDREEAKDLTQEVFLRAFSAPPEHRVGSGLRPWLYRVATNLCLNHLRAGRGRGASTGDEIEQVAAPIDRFQQAQTVALVEETLGQLNDRYRTALVLKDLHGLPSEELAGVMETSRASADVLVHRARASFRSVFTRLAGEGAPVPGNLALVLAPLVVPAALQVMPPLPAAPALHVPAPQAPASHAPASHAPAPQAPVPAPGHAVPPLDGSSAGLMNKLATALGSKVAIAAAAAGLITGGVAVERVVTHSRQDSARAATAAVDRGTSSLVSSSGSASHSWGEHWARRGCPTGDAPCDPDHHAGTAGVHGAAGETDHVAGHAGGATESGHGTPTHDSTGSGGSTGTHDGAGSGATGTHDTTGTGGVTGTDDSTESTTTHDSGAGSAAGESGITGGEH